MSRSVIVAGARTPIGKLGGSLARFRAVELGSHVIAEACRRAGVELEDVDYVVMGQVLLAGQGQNPARQASVGAGISMGVPATTVNKVCLSGLNAIHLADLMIRAGEANVVVAGGMESMTKAPYLLPDARSGYRFGNAEVLDAIQSDGLTCNFDHVLMGASTDRDAAAAGIDRAGQDAFAAQSHDRAAAAIKEGRLADEIAALPIPQRSGDPILFEHDEGVRPETTVESLARLRPAFGADGTVTAGNASQISDGAAAVVVVSAERAAALGLQPVAEILAYGQVAGPDTSLLTQPSRAIRQALEHGGLALKDLDLVEINEAFAAVAIASIDDLGVPGDLVNVNGGAIAVGHPIGMSGARLALTLCSELRRRGGGTGAAALCGGGGQGDAVIVRSLA